MSILRPDLNSTPKNLIINIIGWKLNALTWLEKWRNEGKCVTKESPKSKKPYFGQDMAFLGVKWSQNQIWGPKIHLKLVFNHTFFIEKNFKVDVLDSKSNHTILLGSVSYRKNSFLTVLAKLPPLTTFQWHLLMQFFV